MTEYKRLTTRNEKCEWTIELNEEQKWMQRHLPTDEFIMALLDLTAQRLCDLEDKIENGTLIELPHMHYIERAGVWEIIYLKRGELWHYRCSYKAKAEAKLKELQGE